MEGIDSLHLYEQTSFGERLLIFLTPAAALRPLPGVFRDIRRGPFGTWRELIPSIYMNRRLSGVGGLQAGYGIGKGGHVTFLC